jgi:hypothetical protein
MDAMIGQLLGLGFLGVITYLLLRLRDFFLELGQDSRPSGREFSSSGIADAGGEPQGRYGMRGRFGFQADLHGVGGRLKLGGVHSWRSRKDGGSIA